MALDLRETSAIDEGTGDDKTGSGTGYHGNIGAQNPKSGGDDPPIAGNIEAFDPFALLSPHIDEIVIRRRPIRRFDKRFGTRRRRAA